MRIIPLISSRQLNQPARRSVSPLTEIKNNYIPLRFNQAGVMPIILTTAVLVVPNYISNLGLLPILTLPMFIKSSKGRQNSPSPAISRQQYNTAQKASL